MFGSGGLNWAPRIATIRGLPVHLHWTMMLILGAWVISGAFWGAMGAGWNGFLSGLGSAATLCAALLFIIVWHELGHAWAARRSALRVESILLWPLGGECRISGGMPSPRTELFVSLAGPAAHLLLVAAAFYPLLKVLPGLGVMDILRPAGVASGLARAWSLAVWILIFNLLPAFPLDGGRAFRAALAFRLGEVRATAVAVRVGQVIFALLFVLALVVNSWLLAMLAIYMFFAAEDELRQVRASWQAYDEDSRFRSSAMYGVQQRDWAREAVRRDAPPRESGLVSRLKVRWQLWKLTRATARRDRIKAEVDRILEKVSREGLPALTGREKKILKQASREYRGQR